jgi:hypothetical protein
LLGEALIPAEPGVRIERAGALAGLIQYMFCGIDFQKEMPDRVDVCEQIGSTAEWITQAM